MPLSEAGHRLRMQCFWNFEAFAEETPLHLERSKTKELMASLVDRQSSAASIGELLPCCGRRPDAGSAPSKLGDLIHDLKNALPISARRRFR